MNTQIQGFAGTGSLVLEFDKLTPSALSSLRYMLESEATKNQDYDVARYCFEAARAIHEFSDSKR